MTTADISFDIQAGMKKSRGTKSLKATYPAALRMARPVAAKRAAQAAASRIRNPSGRAAAARVALAVAMLLPRTKSNWIQRPIDITSFYRCLTNEISDGGAIHGRS
jgi:hypothetical protein